MPIVYFALGAIAVTYIIWALAMMTPLFMFVAKAVPVKWLNRGEEYTSTEQCHRMAMYVTGALVFTAGFYSILWPELIANFSPKVLHAYQQYYGKMTGVVPGRIRSAEEYYKDEQILTYLIFELFTFAVATWITFYYRCKADMVKSDLSGTHAVWDKIWPHLVGALVFFIFVKGVDLYYILTSKGLALFAITTVTEVIKEASTVFDFMFALFSSKSNSVYSWLEKEMIEMHGSPLKLAALYPKVFWMFILIQFSASD